MRRPENLHYERTTIVTGKPKMNIITTEPMTTLFFDSYYGEVGEFLGFDARPKQFGHRLFTAVASPAQIAKIRRAIADGVRYEVKHVKERGTHPATVRVYTYGTHKEEVRQEIREYIAWLAQECLSAVDHADRLASDDANPLPPSYHRQYMRGKKGTLDWATSVLISRVCGYIDPTFMQYPRRGRKKPSTP